MWIRNWIAAQLAGTLLPCVCFAQTGADANAWAAWCKRQGGTVQITSSNPVCIPPANASAPANAHQQEMLNLAGQLGSSIGGALGGALRADIEAKRRQEEIGRMQNEWALEQAMRNALREREDRKLRSQQLLAGMKETIGASELGQAGHGSQQLKLKTGDEMFDSVASRPAEPDVNPALRQAWDDYLKALQRKHAADQALRAREAELETARKLQQQAEQNVAAKRSAGDDAALAEARRLLEEAKALEQRAQRGVQAAHSDARAADRALEAAARKKDSVGAAKPG